MSDYEREICPNCGKESSIWLLECPHCLLPKHDPSEEPQEADDLTESE
jgi:hypothetical protein